MRAGELRSRVIIEEEVHTKNEYGETVVSWEPVATVWAKVEDLRGREWMEARQLPTGEVTTRITVRWRKGIDRTMRVRDTRSDRKWGIEAVLEPDDRRKRIELMCREMT